MIELEARQEGRRYPVWFGEGLAGSLAGFLSERDAVAVVSAPPILRTPFGKGILKAVGKAAPVRLVHALPDGEKGKTLAQIEKAAGKLLGAGLTRRSLIVAVGGGAVCDAAGFLAATFMRGIDWVAVPTTLLAMIDASLGGKTAVNLPGAKNAVGAFHPPRAVAADLRALATLPPRELRSGFGEAMKYGALEPALLEHAAALARTGVVEASFLARCARMKLDRVEKDPREGGERKLLNLGHTFGHGVEAAGGFSRYRHGEAVAVGLAFAFRLAAKLGRVDAAAAERLEEALRAARLPTRIPPPIARKAAALMGHDKKRDAAGLRWVLPVRGQEIDGWRVEWDVQVESAAVEATLRVIGGRR
jgi:3-dehydroquinate synthetase